jgi:hypothetical protein
MQRQHHPITQHSNTACGASLVPSKPHSCAKQTTQTIKLQVLKKDILPAWQLHHAVWHAAGPLNHAHVVLKRSLKVNQASHLVCGA